MFNVNVCVVCAEPRTQDSQGGPDEEDEDGEEQGSVHSSREEQEGSEEAEVLQWRGPGTNHSQLTRARKSIVNILLQFYFLFFFGGGATVLKVMVNVHIKCVICLSEITVYSNTESSW